MLMLIKPLNMYLPILVIFCFGTKVVCAIYRPPNTAIDAFITCFEILIDDIRKSKNEYLIAGDYNPDLLKQDSHNGTHLLVNTIYSNYMIPRITRPTRFIDNSSSMVDNIFTNKPDDTSISGILIADISDHLTIFYISKNLILRDEPMFKMVASRQLTDSNINRLKHELSLIDWSDINNLTNTN